MLILRDVLRWRAAEVAEALETTEAAVNSALQRAHAKLAKADRPPGRRSAEPTPEQKAMLDRYVQAFWDKDIDAIVAMLTRDAVWEMPPFTGWYQGAENIGAAHRHASAPAACTTCGWSRPAPTASRRSASTCAAGRHLRAVPPAGAHPRTRTAVSHVAAFFDLALFATFGLPASLPADHTGPS